MKNELKCIGLLVILPLLLTTIGLFYIGDADGYKQSGVLEKTKDVFYYRGDLTTPLDEKAYGGDVVGKYFVMVNVDDVKIIAEFDNQPSKGKLLVGWLVDLQTGEMLNVGHFDENEKLQYENTIIPWIYDLMIITEQSVETADSSQDLPVGGAVLIKPAGYTSDRSF